MSVFLFKYFLLIMFRVVSRLTWTRPTHVIKHRDGKQNVSQRQWNENHLLGDVLSLILPWEWYYSFILRCDSPNILLFFYVMMQCILLNWCVLNDRKKLAGGMILYICWCLWVTLIPILGWTVNWQGLLFLMMGTVIWTTIMNIPCQLFR